MVGRFFLVYAYLDLKIRSISMFAHALSTADEASVNAPHKAAVARSQRHDSGLRRLPFQSLLWPPYLRGIYIVTGQSPRSWSLWQRERFLWA